MGHLRPSLLSASLSNWEIRVKDQSILELYNLRGLCESEENSSY
jgi:hypothetical protein